MALRQKIHLFFWNMETHETRKVKCQRVPVVQVPKGRHVLNLARKAGRTEIYNAHCSELPISKIGVYGSYLMETLGVADTANRIKCYL